MRDRERGQAIILVLLAVSIIMLGAAGLAIDGARLFAQRQMAQAAADAAAQAGIMSIFRGTNITGAHPFATAAPAGSFHCSTTDGRTPCEFARLNGFGQTNADTVTVSFPTSVPGVTKLSTAPVPAIKVAVQRTLGTTLMRLLGAQASSVTATATAALISTTLPQCIVALNPNASGAISITGSADFDLNCGIYVDSSSSSALTVGGSADITASSIDVVGDVRQTGSSSLRPSPNTDADVLPDPLASVPNPSYNPSSSCNYSGVHYSGTQTVTLSPATYCGGVSITGSVTLTLTPGTYIFRGGFSSAGSTRITFGAGTYVLQGGGFSTAGTTSLTGTGVTFFNTSDATHPYAPISMTGSGQVNLSAPTSGPQQGMLFFQDRSAPTGQTETFTGSSNQSMTGALYFPRSTLSYTGSSDSQNTAIIVDKLSVTGSAKFNIQAIDTPAAPHALKVALVE
jgi:hypothetical protein